MVPVTSCCEGCCCLFPRPCSNPQAGRGSKAKETALGFIQKSGPWPPSCMMAFLGPCHLPRSSALRRSPPGPCEREIEGKVILVGAKNRLCGYFRAVLLELEKHTLLQLPVDPMGLFLLHTYCPVRDMQRVLTMTHSRFTFRLCTHRTENYQVSLRFIRHNALDFFSGFIF